MKKTGFSLAEALITLLIVCIIAIASVPVITKKKKAAPEVLWKIERQTESAIYPAHGRNIKLGAVNPKESQGIVVYGTLYFTDRNGNTIGWIKENGESSFGTSENQTKTLEILTALNQQLTEALNAVNTIQQMPNLKGKSKRDAQKIIDSQVSPEQMEQIMQLQNQLKDLMQKNIELQEGQ